MDSIEIKRIDKIIGEIINDSSLQKVELVKTNLENVEDLPKGTTIYYKNNQISRITSCYCDPNNISEQIRNGGRYVNYILNSGELCFVSYQEVDNSRPGSCGYVQITHDYYFKKDKLIKTVVKGSNPCKPAGNLDDTFISPDDHLLIFKKMYGIINEKKPNR